MLLIQAGGLGYMTLSTVFVAAIGRSVSLQERLTLQEALNVQNMEGLVRFAGTVLKLTLAIEGIGAAILTLRWWPVMGFRRRRCGTASSTRSRGSTTPASRCGATTCRRGAATWWSTW